MSGISGLISLLEEMRNFFEFIPTALPHSKHRKLRHKYSSEALTSSSREKFIFLVLHISMRLFFTTMCQNTMFYFEPKNLEPRLNMGHMMSSIYSVSISILHAYALMLTIFYDFGEMAADKYYCDR
mgnify:CR=1 FL=1